MEWCPHCQKHVNEITNRIILETNEKKGSKRIRINKICPECNLSLSIREITEKARKKGV